jgi:hypothetical protein
MAVCGTPGLVDWLDVPAGQNLDWQALLEQAAEAVAMWGIPSSPPFPTSSVTPNNRNA